MVSPPCHSESAATPFISVTLCYFSFFPIMLIFFFGPSVSVLFVSSLTQQLDIGLLVFCLLLALCLYPLLFLLPSAWSSCGVLMLVWTYIPLIVPANSSFALGTRSAPRMHVCFVYFCFLFFLCFLYFFLFSLPCFSFFLFFFRYFYFRVYI